MKITDIRFAPVLATMTAIDTAIEIIGGSGDAAEGAMLMALRNIEASLALWKVSRKSRDMTSLMPQSSSTTAYARMKPRDRVSQRMWGKDDR